MRYLHLHIKNNDIIMNTIADSGADIDVITGKHKDTYENITQVVNTTLNGIGGTSRVHEHLEGLHTTQGIVNDKSDMLTMPIHILKGSQGLALLGIWWDGTTSLTYQDSL